MGSVDPSLLLDLNRVGCFLARRDVERLAGLHFDVLLVPGSSLFRPIELAADLLKRGQVRQVVLAGGIGHSTDYLRESVYSHPEYCGIPTEGRTEAEILYKILVDHLNADPASVLVESRSTNCGANAGESRRLLDSAGIFPETLLLIQDPTMQRRTHASCERAWRDTSTRVVSFAPFVPRVAETETGFSVLGEGGGIWPFPRFLSLIQGEICRLRDDENGYGPKGKNFIDPVELPVGVLESYAGIAAHFEEFNR